jgi:hypothetical protein
MDPSNFVAQSSLRWANDGKPLCTQKEIFRTAVVSPFQLSHPTGLEYQYLFCWWENLPAPLPVPVQRHNIFETNQLTAPMERKHKDPLLLNAAWGFFLDLDNKSWTGVKPPNQKTGPYPNAPPMYVEYTSQKYVVYWFFHGRNHSGFAGFHDYHEGDWERVAVRLDTHNRLTDMAYWQHYCPAETFTRIALEEKGVFTGSSHSHPKVYVGSGSHASYAGSGFTIISCPTEGPWIGIPNGGKDSHKGGGVVWSTWQKGRSGFKNVKSAPWYGYGGGWGSKTNGDTWGPLGPGPLKPPVDTTGWPT